MKDAIDFLDRIEGHGYGGMADYEVARTTVRDAAAEIERLEGVIRVLRDTKGWHIEAGGGKDLLVCCGDHEKGAPCDFHRYRHVDEQRADLIGGPQPEATKRFRDAGA